MNWRVLDHTSGSAVLIEVTASHGTAVLAAAFDGAPDNCFDLLIGSPLTEDESKELHDEFLAWVRVKMACRAKPQCEWPSAAEIIATMEREIAARKFTPCQSAKESK